MLQRIPKFVEVRNSIARYQERRRPDISVRDVADINFGELYDTYGITSYLIDRDGTLTDYHASRVPARVKANINKGRQELRDRGVELQIGIMTNTPPSDEASFVGLNYVAEQIDAGIVIVPEGSSDRKPSQIMPLKGLSYFYNRNGTKPSEVAVVGDKISADVLAASNTGLFSIHVDYKKMGHRDHVGDKWATRPFESMLHIAQSDFHQGSELPELSTAAQQLIAEMPHRSEGSLEEVIYVLDKPQRESASVPEWVNEEIQPIWDYSRIAGFGAEPIVLPQDVLSLLGRNEDAGETSNTRFGKIKATVGAAFNSAVENKGGDLADLLADYRSEIAGPAAAVAILNDKHAQAIGWTASAALADVADGWLARHSRRGATPEGAKKDNEADKKVSRLLNEALREKYPELQKEFDAISASDDNMTNVDRPEMQVEGINTPAVEPGKEAEAINTAAKMFLMTSFAERHPIARKLAIRYAKNKKEARREASKKIWRQEHEELVEGKAVLLVHAEAA